MSLSPRNGQIKKVRPRCPRCGVKDMRWRKKTEDYRCQPCGYVVVTRQPKSETVIANGEYAHATSRTFPQYVYPGKGSRRGL